MNFFLKVGGVASIPPKLESVWGVDEVTSVL